MHRGDEIKGQAATFQEWLGVVARLLDEDPTAATAAAPKLHVTFMAGPGDDAPAAERPGFRARVVANRELLKEIIPGSCSTRFIALDLAGSGMSYETGDHVSVYPQNSPEAVDRLCARLRVDPEGWIATGLVDASGAAAEGETVTSALWAIRWYMGRVKTAVQTARGRSHTNAQPKHQFS